MVGLNRINICLRKKPLKTNEKDIVRTKNNEVSFLQSKVNLTMEKYNVESKYFFDYIFEKSSTNKGIYDSLLSEFISTIPNTKRKLVCFAFGQTGSGKTFTILGDSKEEGLLPITLKDLIKNCTYQSILISSFEIYNDNLYDLLNNRSKVFCREKKKKFYLQGITTYNINDYRDIMLLIMKIKKNRVFGSTSFNSRSSRSHAVIKISLIYNNNISTEITFVDLAGSERAADSIFKDRILFRQNAEINRSLLALKECIRAMYFEYKHIPFRNSKLTSVLRESFMDNCNTLMISNISSCNNESKGTFNTLRYSNMVRNIKKQHSLPEINIVPNSQKLKETIISEKMLQQYNEKLLNRTEKFKGELLNLSKSFISKNTVYRETMNNVKQIIAESRKILYRFENDVNSIHNRIKKL